MGARHELTRMLVPGCRAIIAHAGKTFPASVVSAGEAGLRLQMPGPEAGDEPLQPGGRVAVLAQDGRGLGFFETRIRAFAGDPPCLSLEWPVRYEWRPRREHARVSERLPVTLLLPAPTRGQPAVRLRGYTLDVSTGGLQAFLVESGQAFEQGLLLSVVVEIPDGWPPLEAVASVVRATPRTVEGEEGLAVGLQLTEATEQAWDRVTRYVQIRMRHTNGAERDAGAGSRKAPVRRR